MLRLTRNLNAAAFAAAARPTLLFKAYGVLRAAACVDESDHHALMYVRHGHWQTVGDLSVRRRGRARAGFQKFAGPQPERSLANMAAPTISQSGKTQTNFVRATPFVQLHIKSVGPGDLFA